MDYNEDDEEDSFWADPEVFTQLSQADPGFKIQPKQQKQEHSGQNQRESIEKSTKSNQLKAASRPQPRLHRPPITNKSANGNRNSVGQINDSERPSKRPRLNAKAISTDNLPQVRIREDGQGYEHVSDNTSSVSKAQQAELEQLRSKNQELAYELERSKTSNTNQSQLILQKTGEVSLLRSKLLQTESTHSKTLALEREAKKNLEELLEQNRTDFERKLEKIRTESAFWRRDVESRAFSRGSGGPKPGHTPNGNSKRLRNSPGFSSPLHQSTMNPRAQKMQPPKFPKLTMPAFDGFSSTFHEPKRKKNANESSQNVSLNLVSSPPSSPQPKKGMDRVLESELDFFVEPEEEHKVDNLDEEPSELDKLLEVWKAVREDQPPRLRENILSRIMNHHTPIPIASFHTTVLLPSLPIPRPTVFIPVQQHLTPTFQTLLALPFPEYLPPVLETTFKTNIQALLQSLSRPFSLNLTANQPPVLGIEEEEYTTTMCRGFESILGVLESAGYGWSVLAVLEIIRDLSNEFSNVCRVFLNCTEIYSNARPFDIRDLTASYHVNEKHLLHFLSFLIRKYGKPRPIKYIALTKEKEKTVRLRAERRQRLKKAMNLGANDEQRIREPVDERVVLENEELRVRLVSISLEILERLAWTCRFKGEFASTLKEILGLGDTIACLLHPDQPVDIHVSAVRFLSILATKSVFFYALVGVKFPGDSGNDIKASKVPLLDRVINLVRERSIEKLESEKWDFEKYHRLAVTTLVFLLNLLTNSPKEHESIIFFSQSRSLIPLLLGMLETDASAIYNLDGSDINPFDQDLTDRLLCTLDRLWSLVAIFHFLVCRPDGLLLESRSNNANGVSARLTNLNLSEILVNCTTSSGRGGLVERFHVAFGKIGFASIPDCFTGKESSNTFMEIQRMAIDVMEETSPGDMDDYEVCFIRPDLVEAFEREKEEYAEFGNTQERMELDASVI